jgi:hypothetical protein
MVITYGKPNHSQYNDQKKKKSENTNYGRQQNTC